MPGVCEDYFDNLNGVQKGTMSHIYFAAFAVFVVFGAFLFCFYKRIIKRELNREIQL